MQLSGHTRIPDVFKPIEDELNRVRELIYVQLAEAGEPVSRLLSTFSIGGGKMVRPALILLAGASCGKITDKHIRLGVVTEIIHNATLLHDDVIDEAQKRRSRPTINGLWGNEPAVLLGDFLLTRAFRICADLDRKINEVIVATTERICRGELRQVAQRQNWRVSETEFLEIITEKTAIFFSNCCLLGALLAEAAETEVQALTEYGLNAGVAFQINDDLLDIIGDEEKTGKTLGSDANKNKLTLPVIHFLRTAGKNERIALKNNLGTTTESKAVLTEMLTRSGSLEYAHNKSQEFAAKAVKSLDGLKESAAKDNLIETAEFMTRRTV